MIGRINEVLDINCLFGVFGEPSAGSNRPASVFEDNDTCSVAGFTTRGRDDVVEGLSLHAVEWIAERRIEIGVGRELTQDANISMRAAKQYSHDK